MLYQFPEKLRIGIKSIRREIQSAGIAAFKRSQGKHLLRKLHVDLLPLDGKSNPHDGAEKGDNVYGCPDNVGRVIDPLRLIRVDDLNLLGANGQINRIALYLVGTVDATNSAMKLVLGCLYTSRGSPIWRI